MTRIDLSQTVYSLCTKHPSLAAALAAAGLTDITKPGMLQTAGRFMTIPRGSLVKKIPLEQILAVLAAYGYTAEEENSMNQNEFRQETLRALLARLHAGESAEAVKEQFAAAFDGVSAAEIAEAEQALIKSGVPVTEIQRLCDVHAAVFKGSIEEIHAAPAAPQADAEHPAFPKGHPLHTLAAENRALEAVLQNLVAPALEAFQAGAPEKVLDGALERLAEVHLHYLKKENSLFPFLERAGVTAPPQVMWGVDDEIRAHIKAARSLLAEGKKGVGEAVEAAVTGVAEMIFKEENILFPLLLQTLTEGQWKQAAAEFHELGFCLIAPPPGFSGETGETAAAPGQAIPEGTVRLPSGHFSVAELTALFNTLPFDLTFVDADDRVRYFTEGAERIFPRTRAALGREVIHCHPPASMHIVQKILDDFRAGRRDHADFWIHLMGKYVYIRYFAMRGEAGEYLGTLEVTQSIAPIQALEGDKRLLDD